MNIEIKLKTGTVLPRRVMIMADWLLHYLEVWKSVVGRQKLVEKLLVGPFYILIFIFAKVYLSILFAYVWFCVRILNLPDEEIYPPYNGGK